MKQRSVEWETIFRQTKGNLNFRRFKLRGNEKVSVERGLLMIGQNVKELKRQAKKKNPQNLFSLCIKKAVLKFVCRTFKTAPFLPGTRLELARRLTSEGF